MQNKEGAQILLNEIWPVIKKKIKKARLWIVGKIAPEALSSYKNQKDIVIQEIEDSREAYQKAWVLVAPMRSGGGSRTKFFEAMASGLPIVTTPKGVEGIEAKNGQEIFIDDDLKKLAQRTIEVLEKRAMAKKIGKQAKELVKEKYSWQKSAQKLDKVYQEIGRG
jgi:glycosyltransferase involved in cell wall biosynthesis